RLFDVAADTRRRKRATGRWWSIKGTILPLAPHLALCKGDRTKIGTPCEASALRIRLCVRLCAGVERSTKDTGLAANWRRFWIVAVVIAGSWNYVGGRKCPLGKKRPCIVPKIRQTLSWQHLRAGNSHERGSISNGLCTGSNVARRL